MTVIDVDTSVYYDTGNRLVGLGTEWFAAIDGLWPTLAECKSMTGSYSEARDWAASYDQRAYDLLNVATTIAEAVHAYGAVLLEVGYNHELADYNANIGDTGPPPDKPPTPAPAAYLCRIPLPSAGGPGQGLLDDGIQLVEKIGITIPDGDTTRLAQCAATWAQIAAAAPVAGMAGELERLAGQFETVTSPETQFIDEDLRALRDAVNTAVASFGELSTSAREHHDALVQLRADLSMELEHLAHELAKELAITAAISIAASFVTFGIGAAVGAARAASIAARFARPIRSLIEAWKGAKNLQKGVRVEQNVARHRNDLQRIKNLEPKSSAPMPKPGSLGSLLSGTDRAALWDYTGPGGSESLNWVLRHGGMSRAQELRISDINAALDKLPDYQGAVTRRANLSPEDLARYQSNTTVTEAGFTSTSRSPEAAFDRPVEFQIVSKHGKSVEDFARRPTEQEVLFKSGTQFHVVNRFTDPETGRIIIQMGEI